MRDLYLLLTIMSVRFMRERKLRFLLCTLMIMGRNVGRSFISWPLISGLNTLVCLYLPFESNVSRPPKHANPEKSSRSSSHMGSKYSGKSMIRVNYS